MMLAMVSSSDPELQPTAKGVLSKTPLAHLFVYIADRGMRGSLVLHHATGKKSVVYFVKGHPAKARVVPKTAPLGRILFQLGFIDEETKNSSYEMARSSGLLHGELLIKMGKLDPSQLAVGLREQLSRCLIALFENVTGDMVYEFFLDANMISNWGGSELTPIDPYRALWQAMSLLPNDPAVSSTLERLGPMLLRPHHAVDWNRFGFNAPHLKLLEAMRLTPMSVEDVLQLGILPTRQTKVFLYVLTITKSVEALAPDAKPASGPVESPSSAPGEHDGQEANAPAKKSISPVTDGAVPPSSSTSVPMARVKLKTKAVPVQEKPRLTAEQVQDFRRELDEKLAKLDDMTLFEVLDVRSDASVDTARAAFFALAKKWHPDRLAPELAESKDDAARVFAKLNEAFRTLTSPQKRARYIDKLNRMEEQEGGKDMFQALDQFGKAKVALKKLNFDAALRHATIAHNAVPDNGEFSAVYAWAMAMQGVKEGRDEPFIEPLKMLRELVEENEECEIAHFYMGMVLKHIGKLGGALREFQRAVELNPNNIDAKREIRFARTGTASSPGPKGDDASIDWKNDSVGDLLGKLFKK